MTEQILRNSRAACDTLVFLITDGFGEDTSIVQQYSHQVCDEDGQCTSVYSVAAAALSRGRL